NAGTGHYFDYPITGSVDTYGRVVSVNARQQVTLNMANWGTQCSGGSGDLINAGSAISYGGWPSVDPTHWPDLAYIPYTLFGKEYYYEQEMMEAGYFVGEYTGCYNLAQNYWRQGYLGLQTNG